MPRATGRTSAAAKAGSPAKKGVRGTAAKPATDVAPKTTPKTRQADKVTTKKEAVKPAKASASATTKRAARTKATKSAANSGSAGSAGAAKRTASVDKFVEGQRKVLLDERATYTRHAASLRAEADQLAAEREPGDVQFDEESGEGDTLAVERERDLALSAQAQQSIEDIDAALARIDAGTYGTCVQCGEPIPRERLRALPQAALCVRCKSGGLGRR